MGLNEELKQELIWAIDNIPPWDDFWLSIPDQYVYNILNIIPGNCSGDQQVVFSHNSSIYRNQKKFNRLEKKARRYLKRANSIRFATNSDRPLFGRRTIR